MSRRISYPLLLLLVAALLVAGMLVTGLLVASLLGGLLVARLLDLLAGVGVVLVVSDGGLVVDGGGGDLLGGSLLGGGLLGSDLLVSLVLSLSDDFTHVY